MSPDTASPADPAVADMASLLRDVVAVLHDCRTELSALRAERVAPSPLLSANRESYSTTEAAKILGREPYTVMEWARMGQCNAFKPGRSREWRIKAEEVVRIQEEGLLAIDLKRNLGRRR